MQALEKKPETPARHARFSAKLGKGCEDVVEYDVPQTGMTTIPMKGHVDPRLKGFKRNFIWASLAITLVVLGGVIAGPWFPDLVGEWYDWKDKLSNSASLDGRVESPAPNMPKPVPSSTDLPSPPTPDDQTEVNRQFQDHIKVARFLRERGDYADAIAELGKAKSVDPANGAVDIEMERVLKACKAEMEILKRADLNC